MSKGKLRNYEPEPNEGNLQDSSLKVSIEQSKDAWNRAEAWAQSLEYTYTDDELKRINMDCDQDVQEIVNRNCLRVYLARARNDPEESKRLAPLEDHLSSPEKLAEVSRRAAIAFVAEFLRLIPKGQSEQSARLTIFRVHRQIMHSLLLTTDNEVSLASPADLWRETFGHDQALDLKDKSFKSHYRVYVVEEAKITLEHDIKPVEWELKLLRALAGVTWLEDETNITLEPGETVADLLATADIHIPDRYMLAFSMMPSQTIDRAARGPAGWEFPTDDAPTFSDANNSHAVTYYADGLTQEVLREGVMQLNPRTADVWRLCTAAILEGWERGRDEPSSVRVDAKQLCDAMGFKKHHNGGHFPQNVEIAAQALVDLERFYINIPLGEKQYPRDHKTGKRKKVKLEAREQQRVLIVSGKRQLREMPDGKWMSLEWSIRAGEWIKAYPREQFAPLFRALVELPGGYTSDLWAKAIGTELIWQYRMDKGPQKVQRIETMLKQACVLDEVLRNKDKKRARDYFEKAMDKLQESGVCRSWEYNGGDIDGVESTTRGWFDRWLQVRVIVTPPAEVVKVMKQIAAASEQHRKKAEKAAMKKQLAS